MKVKFFTTAVLAGIISASVAYAQTSPRPELVLPGGKGTSLIVNRLSDNGKWTISEIASQTEGSLAPAGGVLINVETLEQTDISHNSRLSGVSDVTDDGKIVVGEATGKPAYWSADKNAWVTLPLPSGYGSGRLNAVTPDGKYAVGYANPSDDVFKAGPIMYDLTTGSLIDLPGMIVYDKTGKDRRQNAIYEVSPDGRYLLGTVSQSYLLDEGQSAVTPYIYDRQNGTYTTIGYTMSGSGATATYTPRYDGLYFAEAGSMSPNGEWVTGMAYLVKDIPGSQFPSEYRTAYRYNIPNDTFEVFDGEGESDVAGMSILNDGTVLACTPSDNPYASTLVRLDGYYVPLELIYKNVYGIDFKAETGLSINGKSLSVSSDGRTIILLTSMYDTYLLKMKEDLADAARRVNLLDSYTVDPAAGTTMGLLSSVKITFDKKISVRVPYNRVTFESADGTEKWNPVSSNGLKADGNSLTITFRTRQLRKDQTYTLTLPEGAVGISGMSSMTSKEIKITYNGRGQDALALTEAYPADGTAVPGLDLTSNPLILTFDADIKLAEGASGKLYRVGEDEPFCALNILVNGKRALLYPTSGQRLFDGTDYKVVVPAGTFTDVSGSGSTPEIVLNYRGSYVRQITSDDRYIFSDDCDSYDNFLLYDGDRLAPSTVPAGWGFTANNPWYRVRDNENNMNHAMAAHSMYRDGGKADDWMVTAQLFIPDDKCYLSFDAQSYLFDMNDILKVYVYTSDNIYNTLNATVVADIRAKGDLVFDKKLDPGATEEGLAGEWTRYTVDLAKYSGKNIYIAFVNENQGQSAIFIDNVQVVHDLEFLTTFEHRSRVVGQQSASVKGFITVASERNTYSSATFTLLDASGTEIDRISESGLNLKKNDVYKFEFSKPLPLQLGISNRFQVRIDLDDITSYVQSDIKNLTFEPVKRVVLEEYSGAECGNCPQGLQVVDNLLKEYPGKFIPVVIRTYEGDELSKGVTAYSQYLGLDNAGAPSGRINRDPVILYPMFNNGGDVVVSGKGIKDETTGAEVVLWTDKVRSELEIPAELEVSFRSDYAEGSGRISVSGQVRSAMDMTNANINVFAAITENNVETYQKNYYTSISDPDLGPWGANGSYGSLVYPFYLSHVARGHYGTTYNGTGGLVPQTLNSSETYPFSFEVAMPATIEKAEVYDYETGQSSIVNNWKNANIVVMLIDGVSGSIINANVAAVGAEASGVESIVLPGAPAALDLKLVNGGILAEGTGLVQAQAYTISGQLIAAGSADTTLSLDLAGYRGVVIVKAVDETGAVSAAKFVVR